MSRQSLGVDAEVAKHAFADRGLPAAARGCDGAGAQPSGAGIARTCGGVQLSLLRAPSSVRLVRVLVRGIAGVWKLDELLVQDVELVASELSTNAVLHGGSASPGSFEVRLVPQPQALRIEVADAGLGSISQQAPVQTAESGRGLLLVSRVCQCWGVDQTDYGTVVWAELNTGAA